MAKNDGDQWLGLILEGTGNNNKIDQNCCRDVMYVEKTRRNHLLRLDQPWLSHSPVPTEYPNTTQDKGKDNERTSESLREHFIDKAEK